MSNLFYPQKVADTKLITRDVSLVFMWAGLLFLIPMFVSILYGEANWPIYLALIALTSGPAYLLSKIARHDTKKPFTDMTLITLAAAWLILSLVGAYPFFFMTDMGVLDSYFESVSSISTAGITNIALPESFPPSILLWRTVLAWIGGIGITAFAFYTLMQSESIRRIVAGEGFERLRPSIVNSAKIIFKIYCFWTVAGIIALLLLGVPAFDSLNLSMNAVSTTGADVRNGGWLYYQDSLSGNFPIFAGVMLVLMFAGATSFVAHYRVFKGKNPIEYFRDQETKWFIGILAGGALAFFLFLTIFPGNLGTPNQDPIVMSYEAMSTSTTGGFEIFPYVTGLPETASFLMFGLFILALIGGSTNSAAGGLKVKRIILLLHYVSWKLKQQIAPKGAISHFKLSKKPVSIDEVTNAATFIFIYCFAIFLVLFLVLAAQPEMNVQDGILMVASAQSGGGVTPIPAYDLAWQSKFFLLFTMMFGRLEFIPLLAMGAFLVHKR